MRRSRHSWEMGYVVEAYSTPNNEAHIDDKDGYRSFVHDGRHLRRWDELFAAPQQKSNAQENALDLVGSVSIPGELKNDVREPIAVSGQASRCACSGEKLK